MCWVLFLPVYSVFKLGSLSQFEYHFQGLSQCNLCIINIHVYYFLIVCSHTSKSARVGFCSCLCIVCSSVSEALMLAMCSPFLFLPVQSLLTCFQKLSYSLCRLCLSLSSLRRKGKHGVLLLGSLTQNAMKRRKALLYVLRRGIQKHCTWRKWLT